MVEEGDGEQDAEEEEAGGPLGCAPAPGRLAAGVGEA